MKLALHVLGMACAGLVLASGPAHAIARLVSVTAVDGGCVAGPTGGVVQAWDVEPGRRYELLLANVTECGNGGTASTIAVRVSHATGGTELMATQSGPGQYICSFRVPPAFTCSGPVSYCVTLGSPGTGLIVLRNDGGMHQAQLRAAAFGPDCGSPTPASGPACAGLTFSRSWGQLKTIYR